MVKKNAVSVVVYASHPGTGKYFTISSQASGLAMQVDGDVIEAGSKVMLAERVVSKVTGSNMAVPMRQQFCCDEMTGTIRSQFRHYCLDIDQSMSRVFLAHNLQNVPRIFLELCLSFSLVLSKSETYNFIGCLLVMYGIVPYPSFCLHLKLTDIHL